MTISNPAMNCTQELQTSEIKGLKSTLRVTTATAVLGALSKVKRNPLPALGLAALQTFPQGAHRTDHRSQDLSKSERQEALSLTWLSKRSNLNSKKSLRRIIPGKVKETTTFAMLSKISHKAYNKTRRTRHQGSSRSRSTL